MARFGQIRLLESLLLGTGYRVLAEAASQDRVWGVGFITEEALAPQNREQWGENRLGKVLMEAVAPEPLRSTMHSFGLVLGLPDITGKGRSRTVSNVLGTPHLVVTPSAVPGLICHGRKTPSCSHRVRLCIV